MDTSEVPVNSIGRSIWTVWGYLTGAVARYLRPEVTNEGNPNVNSATDDTVIRSTTKQVDRQVKEIAEKEQGEKNYNQNDKNTGAVKCLLPEAREVNEDNTPDFNTTIKQTYNAAVWCRESDRKQEGEIIIPDVQENIENEQKPTKCDAHMEKEASDGSLAKNASNKERGIKTEQKPNETEDIEQKDGHNEDTKEESDHYKEDDGETCVMTTDDLDGTEVTIQSVLYERDQQQKEMINKMDFIETEDTRTEYAMNKIVCKDQEIAENDNDEESESLENDEDLLAKLVHSTEEETELPKPFEIETVRVKETCLENIKNEGIQTPEGQESIFSKNVVEMPETKGTNEQDKQGHEQHKWQDNCEFPDIFTKEEASEKKLEMVETLPGLSKQTFEENVTFDELVQITTTEVNEGVKETFDASEDTMQSDSLEFNDAFNVLLNSMLVEGTEIEQDLKTPISSMELGTKPIQTLQEMAKFSLKECAELRTELVVETMKSQIDSEEKAEDFMKADQADNEIIELNIEKECTTVDTISESLMKGKGDSSVEINGKELNAGDTPDVTEEKNELIMDLQENTERHTEKLENMKAEVRLLDEADALTTVKKSDHYKEDDGETCVMKTDDLDGTEVTIQSVLYERDQQQKEMINKMDFIETEDTRTEYAMNKIVCKDQEIAENDNDEESESLENDEDLLAKLVHSTEEETELPKPFEIEKVSIKETCLENIKNEGIQTPEGQESIFSKNVVEMPETKGTNEQDKQGHEQHKWQDNCEFPDIFTKEEASEKKLEMVETLPGLSKQTFEENVTFDELVQITTTEVNEGVKETFDASEDTMQSDSLEFNDAFNVLLNSMLVEGTEIEQDLKTPISSMELGTKPIQTLQEMAKFSLKECAELRTELVVETMKSQIDSEEKAEDFMKADQADNEIIELNIEKECTTVDTISESLMKGKGDSSVEINGKELNAGDTPDVTEEKNELIMDLQENTERHTEKLENMKAEVRLLDEADALTTVKKSDHYKEDDGETCVMKTDDLDGTEVTIQSVLYERDQQQKEMINKMDFIETEDTRTEYAMNKIVCKDQEIAENDNDEESESLENDEDLLAKLVHSTEEETELPKPFEIEKVSIKETCLENIKNEGIQTPEGQESIFSKNVVEMPETKGTNEQDKQGHEQHKWQDNCEFPDIFTKEEASEKKLEMVETLSGLSKQTFEENVTFDELVQKTTTEVNEGVKETFDASEDTMQSDSLEFNDAFNVLLNSMLVEGTEIEQDLKTPISSMELGTKPIQTLQEMAKFSLKECAELRTELVVETMKSQIDSEEKAEDFMKADQADNEIIELNIEKECTTVDTISESLMKGKGDSSVEINGKELNAGDTPDVTEEKNELIMDLQENTERHTEKLENMKAEVRLLDEADALTTVESLDDMMNQILKETMEMENKFLQEPEPSSETSCNVEFQRPTSSALLLEAERELLGDTVESLVEMVDAGIYEAVNKQTDQHNVSSPECEPTDADRGFKQLEKNTVGETLFPSNDGMSEINRPGLKRRFDDMSKDPPKVKDQTSPLVEWSTTADVNVQQSSLDFSVQKSRIAVKNPLVRAPKDPRKLLNKTSMEPSLPKPAPCRLLKGSHGVAVSVQSKGVIGFKLPGMVAELSTLRKTEFGSKVRKEEKAESTPQKEQKSVAETENSVKQEQASLKPKWTPPKHPGMGSPLMMAELKSKLKMPLKE